MDCKYFDTCSAPMCPKDAEVGKTAWFPDEEICHLVDVPEWVKRQRKIARTGANETAGSFTLAMLKRDCIIKKGITGIDPEVSDFERKTIEKVWLEKHHEIKPISDERKEKMRAMACSSVVSRRLKLGLKNSSGRS